MEELIKVLENYTEEEIVATSTFKTDLALSSFDTACVIDEIEEALEVFEVKNRAFDLLCHINGAPKRVRFDCGKHFSPIGIFPFEDDDFYIIFKHLGEESNRHNINNKRLPVLEDLA